MEEDNGACRYSGLLVRAQQAYKLTAGMEGTQYGEWREDYKNGMTVLAQLIAEPYPALSELRKQVSYAFGRVIHGLKPHQIALSYTEPIKTPEMEKIDSSLQFKYVQKCANDVFAPHHHVRLRLPVQGPPADTSCTYTKYAIGQAIVDVHTLQDGVWTVQTKQRRDAVVHGKHCWNNKNHAVVNIPGQWKCDQSGTFMSLGMNQHRQIQVWTGNHASNEVYCLTLKERNPKSHVLHTFREPTSRSRGTRSPEVQSPGPPIVHNSMSAGQEELQESVFNTTMEIPSGECTSTSAQTSSKRQCVISVMQEQLNGFHYDSNARKLKR
jgi:hypothetical protein